MSSHDDTTSVEYRLLADPGYRVGADGSFWSRYRPNSGRLHPWRRLKGWRSEDGYISVDVKGRTFLLHRLILQAFIGPCPDGMEACHENGNPADNRLGNLRWDSHGANMRDAIGHGTFRRPEAKGSRHGGAKLAEGDILAIRAAVLGGENAAEVARRFGVDRYQIYSIMAGKTWQHVPWPDRPAEWPGGRKPRDNRGSKNPRATLDERQVAQIKAMIGLGLGNPEIARVYGVAPRVICKIRCGQTWRHVASDLESLALSRPEIAVCAAMGIKPVILGLPT